MVIDFAPYRLRPQPVRAGAMPIRAYTQPMSALLDADAVVAAGVDLAHALGVESIGVRAVAARLDVTPMALYRHVEDGAALRTAIIDRLLAEVPHVPQPGAWHDRYRTWARSARPVFARTPGLARFVLTRWVTLPAMLEIVDELLAVADQADVDIDQVAAANAVFVYVLMRAEAEHAVRRTGTLRRNLAQMRAHGQRLPHLSAHVREYSVARLDEHFAFGLEALLAGVPLVQRTS